MTAGPLAGTRVVEMGGLGPCPLCGMLLADLGAKVIRIDRKTAGTTPPHHAAHRFQISRRGRPTVLIDLKSPAGRDAILTLLGRADAVIEGFRPGTMERLGLGPDEALARNPRLVYGRVTGWGQDGPLAGAPGHDINYISLTGALDAIGERGRKPVPPLSLVGDFGGGTMLLAVGVLAALLETKRSGAGQVVDAAMVDGAALLMAEYFGMVASGYWSQERGTNVFGGSHFYDVYETADGRYVSVGAVEPQFYTALRERLGLTDPSFDGQHDRKSWPELKAKIGAIFRTRTRDEWCELLEGSDACVAPVLSMSEAASHPHNRARGAYVEIDGVVQPAPAPRFSATPLASPGSVLEPGVNTVEYLQDWGLRPDEIDDLQSSGALGRRRDVRTEC